MIVLILMGNVKSCVISWKIFTEIRQYDVNFPDINTVSNLTDKHDKQCFNILKDEKYNQLILMEI